MHVAVTAVGNDRPGIVAAVTEVLFEVGANIEDSRMATLGGHFAMMLIVELQAVSPQRLEEELHRPADDLDLTISVRAIDDAAAERDDGEPYVVSVYGADHPGIVARVSGLLADHGVNISDLATHVLEGDRPVYVMVMEVTLPAGVDAGALEADLKALAGDIDVDLSIHPMEPDTL